MNKALMVSWIVLSMAGGVMADVVYNSGAPFGGSGDTPPNGYTVSNWQMAEDFQIATANTVNGASIPILSLVGNNLGQANLAGWDGTLQWAIYASVATVPADGPNQTKPGALIASGNGVGITTTPAGVYHDGGVTDELYTFDFSFGQDVSIAANTRYWFALHLNSTYSQKFLYWRQSDSAAGDRLVGRSGGVGTFGYQGAYAAYTLVPSPASASLLGLGGLALTRRRRTAR